MQLALFTSAIIVGLSTALPFIRVQPDLETSNKKPRDDQLDLHTKTTILKRSPTSPRLPQTVSPARRLAPNKVSSRPLAQPNSVTRPKRKLSAESGNGITNGKSHIKVQKLPPAEATGLLYGHGYYQTTTDDRLLPSTIETHKGSDHPEGKTVTGPVSAQIKSVSVADGSKSTAQGMHKVIGSVESTPYSAGCITCKQPGYLPMIVDVAPGTGKVTVSAYNAMPKFGPVQITAETNGFGETTAAASNQPI